MFRRCADPYDEDDEDELGKYELIDSKNCSEKGSKNGSEKGSKNGSERGSKSGSERGSKNGRERGSKNGSEKDFGEGDELPLNRLDNDERAVVKGAEQLSPEPVENREKNDTSFPLLQSKYEWMPLCQK